MDSITHLYSVVPVTDRADALEWFATDPDGNSLSLAEAPPE